MNKQSIMITINHYISTSNYTTENFLNSHSKRDYFKW